MREGTCRCGAVGYEVEGGLEGATRCHCSQCRQVFGGVGSAMSRVEAGGFRWSRGESLVTRYGVEYGVGFCSVCGATLVGYLKESVFGITLSSLVDDEGLSVARHIFVGSKASWDEIGGDAPQHHAWPEG